MSTTEEEEVEANVGKKLSNFFFTYGKFFFFLLPFQKINIGRCVSGCFWGVTKAQPSRFFSTAQY